MRKTKETPKFLTNINGNEIPIEKVRVDHYKKHVLVEDTFLQLEDISAKMEKVKNKMERNINKYVSWISAYNGLTDVKVDNLVLTNYSGTKQIVIKNSSVIDFDENLQLAKAKIDECFKKWGSETHPNIRLIVDKFFKVGKKGFVNKQSILSLFQFDIKDVLWKEAMELIKKSIHETAKKEYMFFRYRENNKSEWKTINLNFSSMEV